MKKNGIYIRNLLGLGFWSAHVYHRDVLVAQLRKSYSSKRACLNNVIKFLRVDGVKIFIENRGKLEEYGK